MEESTNFYRDGFFNNLCSWYKTSTYTDVTLVMKEDKNSMKAHACVLAAASSKFHEDLQAIKVKGSELKIEVHESLTHFAMTSMLEFIYSGEVSHLEDISSTQIIEIFAASVYYKIDSLTNILQNKLNLLQLQANRQVRISRKRKGNVRYTDYDLNEDQSNSNTEEEEARVNHRNEESKKLLQISEKTGEESYCNEELLENDVDDTKTTIMIRNKARRFVTQVIQSGNEKKIRQKVKKLHKCIDCGATYKTMIAVHNHRRWHAEEGHMCTKCAQSFQTAKALKKHSIKHTPKSKSQCEVCKRNFTNLYVLKLHMRTHTGDETFICDICGKKFPYGSSLKTHRLIHKDTKDFMCSVCGKGFTQKIHAKEHELQHTGEKRFQCLECGQFFQHNSGLARHVSDIHIRDRKFVCEQCGKSFSRKSKLQEHERIHTGEKPYICDVCGVSYKANRSLRHHKKTQHKIDTPKYQIGISHRLDADTQKTIKQLQDKQQQPQMHIPTDDKRTSIDNLEFIKFPTQDQPYTTMTTVGPGTGQDDITLPTMVQTPQMLQQLDAAGVAQLGEQFVAQYANSNSQLYTMPITSVPANAKPTFIVPLSATASGGPGSSVLVTYMVSQQQHPSPAQIDELSTTSGDVTVSDPVQRPDDNT